MKRAEILVAVLLGGRSAERAVSQASGRRVIESLTNLGYSVVELDADAQVYERLQALRPTVVFNALHGTWGEDGRMQALLDWLEIPYTGSGVLGCALSFDKHLTKKLLQAEGLPTPAWSLIAPHSDFAATLLMQTLPCVLKPRREGSSTGVCLIRTAQEQHAAAQALQADPARQEFLLEAYIAGREFTVGILGDDVLPVIEICTAEGHPFYTYDSKYLAGGCQHLVPAPIDGALKAELSRLALATHQLLGLRDYSRTDILVDEKGHAWILEINALPGLTAQSLIPDAAAAQGLDYDELIERILVSALKRASA